MDASIPFLGYWYFHLPNYALAVMQYATIARFLLGQFVDENWQNYIWRGFKAVSAPAVATVGMLTPRAVPHPVQLIFTILWLQVARVALFLVLAGLGLAPRVGG